MIVLSPNLKANFSFFCNHEYMALMLKVTTFWGHRDSTLGMALTLHVADPRFHLQHVVSCFYQELSMTGKAKYKCWALPGKLKTKQNGKKKKLLYFAITKVFKPLYHCTMSLLIYLFFTIYLSPSTGSEFQFYNPRPHVNHHWILSIPLFLYIFYSLVSIPHLSEIIFFFFPLTNLLNILSKLKRIKTVHILI